MDDLHLKIIRSEKSEKSNNKKSELKQEIIRLEVVEKPAVMDTEITTFIKDFAACMSVEKQLQLIKQTYKPELDEGKKKLYLQLFCKIYFQTPWKHPVKNCLSKIIDNETQFIDDVKSYLCDEITYAIKPCQYVIYISNSELREIIGNVGALLENFECGTIAFRESLDAIFTAYDYTLRWYWKKLTEGNVSPATKNYLCSSIHNLIKIVIHALQLFGDTLNLDKITGFATLRYILQTEEIPIDTKANAGILTVMYCKGLKEDPFEACIKTGDNIRELCIVFGVITHLNAEYLKVFPNSVEKVLTYIEPVMKSNIHDSLMALFIARAVCQLSKRLEALPADEPVERVVMVCEEYAIRSLDHDLDAVKNTAKEILQNLIGVGLHHIPKVMETIFELIKSDSTNKTHKSIIIACICQVAGAKYVCQEIPNVQELLLNALENSNNYNTNSETVLCYEKLMTNRLNNGMDHNLFFNEFIIVILDTFNKTNQDAIELRKSLTKLLHKSIKKCSYIVDLLLAETLPIELSLSCLGAAKKSGFFNNRTSTTEEWKSLLPFKSIKSAMISNNAQNRMAAFELIIEVHRLTEIFTNEEFECILYFLKHNINSEVPAIRSQIIGHMRNCLYRIENGLNFFNRNPSDLRVKYYNNFVLDLAKFCFDNFFPGANFGRRTSSLKILLQLFDSIKGCAGDLCSQIWSVERFDTVLNLCHDTYESNKADAIVLLKHCPKEFMHNRDVNLNVVENMIQSCKPMTTLTGAYYLEFLVFVHMNEENQKEMMNTDSVVLNAILWLERLLLRSYAVASESLMKAACQCPMYGELFAMRHLLSKIEFKRGDPCTNQWKDFLSRFIPLCNKLTEIAAPIVNNSSPEGHLPNDFSSMENYANEDEILSNVTPQMILLCAWRTVKEVSLLLGDISFKAPLVSTKPDSIDTGYISVSQILGIGTHFTTLLSETKHRGAFEQAYVGFSRLSSRLWSCDELELHSLPMRWLQALLKIIAGETIVTDGLDMSVEKLCATRRSAGVPFLMQALVTAELQVGKSSALKLCMEHLLVIAREGTSCESRTHALNILRAMYRSSELSQAIGQYISNGFVVAIQAYDADTWAERNSATLLFSSLMLRVFGVQRHKDPEQMNIKNKMTGRIFFQRYPELYDFFYNILVESQKISQKGNRCRKIHSLLLLLARLYPSSWEEIDSNLSLMNLIPLISGCTANPELKTRQLAAKIIPIIIQPDKVLPRITKLVQVVFESNLTDRTSQSRGMWGEVLEKTPTKLNKIKVNSYHGALLQILYLVKSLSVGSVSKDEQKYTLTKEWNNIQTYLYDIRFAHIPVIVATFCDILLEMYLRITEVTFKDGLSAVIDDIYKQKYEVPGLGHDIMMRKYGIYNFLIHFTSENIMLEQYFTQSVASMKYGYDFHESILNMLVLVTNLDTMDRVATELDITNLEVALSKQILKRWGVDQLKIIRSIESSDALGRYLINLIDNDIYHQCTSKAYVLISQSKVLIKQFMSHKGLSSYESLIELAENESGLIQEAMYACISKCFQELDEKTSINIGFVKNLITPDNSDSMKMIGIKMLEESYITNNFCNMKPGVPFITNFFWCLLVLLRDDDAEIRYKTAGFAMKIFNDFYGKQEDQNIIASKATEHLFSVLNSNMTKHTYTKVEIKTVYQQILQLDKELLEVTNETNAAIDETNRCFDKNETNLFGENKFVHDECQKYLAES